MLPGAKKQAAPNPEGQMELVEHLAELRTRLFRVIIFIIVGMLATYKLFPNIFDLLWHPIAPQIEKLGGKIVFSNATEAFLLRLQVSFIAGIAAACPFIILEI